MAHPWLGNVRELRDAIERAAIIARGREVRPEHLPYPGRSSAQLDLTGHGSWRAQRQLACWSEEELGRAPAD